MAIFWKHIKGTGSATTNNIGLWTWIQWANGTPDFDISKTPKIILKDNDELNEKDLGNILTTHADKAVITHAWAFPGIKSRFDQDIKINLGQERIVGDSTVIDKIIAFTIPNTSINFQNGIKIYANNKSNAQITLEASSGKAEAIYFNATSDKRAKQEIEAVTASALDIIKQVQVYTFEYKNNPGERMLGVLAQEFLDKPLDDVSFVSNENATGENNDYMSIKESKLVYLLLKGMQEQQEQIELLKQKIDDLENWHYSAEYKVEDK